MDEKGRQILSSKYKPNTPIISAQKDADIKALATQLCSEISVMNGWSLPPTKTENFFYESLAVVLKMKYDFLNYSELRLAFRLYSSSVVNYITKGEKPITIPIIESVLQAYLADREIVIEEEKQFIERQVADETKESVDKKIEYAKSITRKSIQENYELFLEDKYVAEKNVCGHIEYDMLVNDSMISKNLKADYFSAGLYRLKAVLNKRLNEAREKDTEVDKNSIKKQINIKQIQEELNILDRVEVAAKKEAFIMIFNSAKKQGIKNLYEVVAT